MSARGETMRKKTPAGYIVVRQPTHPRAGKENGFVFEHILVAEKAMGRYLALGNIVHHVNGIRDDNRPENLVVCEDHAYHMILHQRQRAVDAGYPVHWVKCAYCSVYEPPIETEYVRIRKRGFLHHVACHKAAGKAQYRKKASGEARHTFRAAPSPYPPHWRRCVYCKQYDDPKTNQNLVTTKTGFVFHKPCCNRHQALKRIGL